MTPKFRVAFSTSAETDLVGIWLAIAENNPAAADRFLDRLHERIDTLAGFPERGTSRPDIVKGIRMLVEGSYLIFYTIDGATVTIARVLHGARDIESLFDE